MDIKDFVKATITSVIDAVNEINSEKKGVTVCPENLTLKGENNCFTSDGRLVKNIDFDLCVTDGIESDTGAGVKISIFKVGVDSKTSNEAVNRIKFSIPIAFPSTTHKTY